MATVEWSDPAYADMARVLSSAIGISFPESRRQAVEQAMAAVWQRAGAPRAEVYAAALGGGAPVDDLVNEIVIGETYFFRDAGQFQVLRRELFPELRQRGGRGLMMWSAGCATGEEAYSLAIAAAESAPDGAQDLVYATDVSTRSLAAARAGVYGAWSMRGVPAEMIERIAEPRGPRYAVRDRWRQRVEFAHSNLAGEVPPAPAVASGAMDLILCRNVLIYLDDAAVRRCVAWLYSALRDGGYLLTSPTDQPLWDLAPFATRTTSAGIVYCRRDTRPARQPAAMFAVAAELSRAAAGSPGLAALPPARAPRRTPAPEPPARAEAAFATGNWPEAARWSAGLDDEAMALVHVRATANAGGTADAEAACAAAASKYPTSTALHHLHALLLLELDRLGDAARAARRVLFLDSTLAVGHLALATIARRAVNLPLARRSYRNARDLLCGVPDDAPVALGEDQRAGALRRAAEAALASLGDAAPQPPMGTERAPARPRR